MRNELGAFPTDFPDVSSVSTVLVALPLVTHALRGDKSETVVALGVYVCNGLIEVATRKDGNISALGFGGACRMLSDILQCCTFNDRLAVSVLAALQVLSDEDNVAKFHQFGPFAGRH